jgi:hypothetical protein
MKKTILFTLAILVSVSVIFAQSNLSMSTIGGDNVPANSVVNIMGSPADFETIAYMVVTNNGTADVDLMVKKVPNYLPEGSDCLFCLGLCYPPTVFVSTIPVTLAPGQSTGDEEFSGHYSPNGFAGTSSVSYVFFDNNNVNDSIMVTFNYIITDTESGLSITAGGAPVAEEGVTFTGLPEDDLILSHLEVTNNSEGAIDVKVRRVVNYLVPGSVNAFCWGGLCFSPETSVSPNFLTLEAGATTTFEDFSGDYQPVNTSGISSITYEFFNAADSSDFAGAIVFYATTVGVNENVLDQIELSNAYPNPANSFATFDYDLKGIDNGRLIIYNLLGSVVKEVNIATSYGSVKVNTSDLEEGIYFYSLLIENESLKTHKLIIKH